MRERDRKHRKSFSKFIVVPNVIGSARAIDPRRNKVKHEDHSKRKKKIMENIDGKKKEDLRGIKKNITKTSSKKRIRRAKRWSDGI